MKLFQSIQKCFSILGISSNQSRFNGRMVSAFIVFSLGVIISTISLFIGTKTFKEYTDEIYVACAAILFVILFTNMIRKMEKLFELIDSFEMLVEKSELKFQVINLISTKIKKIPGSEHPESKVLYDEVNRLVEKCSEIAYFVMVKLTAVCIVLPKFGISMFVYLTTDLGYDAFELPFPAWWVDKIG